MYEARSLNLPNGGEPESIAELKVNMHAVEVMKTLNSLQQLNGNSNGVMVVDFGRTALKMAA